MSLDDAHAQSYQGSLYLKPIPSSVYSGSAIEFSGRLSTTSGHVVPDMIIYIKDNVRFGSDTTVMTLRTDSSGNFYGTWTARERSSGAYDFYAEFKGNSQVKKDKSSQYSVTVYPRSGSPESGESGSPSYNSYTGVLRLDSISSTVSSGYSVTFSGRLTTTSDNYVPNEIIYIKDNVRFGSDNTIMTLRTNSQGYFSGTWTAQERSSGAYDFYAEFKGSSQVSKAKSSERSVTVSSQFSGSPDSGPLIFSTYSTSIMLSGVPSSVQDGDMVKFTGRVTTGGLGIPNSYVVIKEDDRFSRDQVLGSGYADTTGKFSISWTAKSGLVEDDFDVYAEFPESGQYEKSQSSRHTMTVVDVPTTYSTTIVLNDIPASVYAGDKVTFTGWVNSGGQGVAGTYVIIKEDDRFSRDQILGAGSTDSSGRFSIDWTVKEGLLETDFDVYAEHSKAGTYDSSQSSRQTMTVLESSSGSITLDPLPKSARVGEIVTFSGILTLDEYSPRGAIIYIKDSDPARDDLLATGYADSSGRFLVDWVVTYVDVGSKADIYAVFEGTDKIDRISTCNNGKIRDVIGFCKNPISLEILKYVPVSPKPTPPKPTGDEYIELYHSLDSNPHVAISPSPDSVNDFGGYISPIYEGVNLWSKLLETKYGGDWDVTFEIITPNKPFIESEPDIMINLVTREEGKHCGDPWGWAEISTRNPVQAYVCSSAHDHILTYEDISFVAGHEFIHAMGLGHTFNKPGDMMCSTENGKPTCKASYSHSKTPSDLNVDAVRRIYGTDGFSIPNNNFERNTKFRLGDPQVDDKSTQEKPQNPVSSTDERRLTYQTIKVEDSTGSLKYVMDRGDILKAAYDSSYILTLNTISSTDGTLHVSIPRSVLDARSGSIDEEFLVLVDSVETEFEEYASETDRALSILLAAGSDTIEIIGTHIATDGGTVIPVNTKESGVTVELDQKVYTWTDRVFITIIAPSHNLDSSKIDRIGSPADPLTVSTQRGSLSSYSLLEIGSDTGIFAGEVTLTGFRHDADGDEDTGDTEGNDVGTTNTGPDGSGPTDGRLPAGSDDVISVTYGLPGKEATASAQIRWNAGEIEWIQSPQPTLLGIVRIIDPDMNWNPDVADEFEVSFFSDTDRIGSNAAVVETDKATGIFEGEVFFTSATATSKRLKFTVDDKVTVAYADHTLPGSHTTDHLNVEVTEILRAATIVEKENRITDASIQIPIGKKIIDGKFMAPHTLWGSMITSRGSDAEVNLMVATESGTCVIGPSSECLVSESTRSQGQIYEIVKVDGVSLKVMYSGPDARLEKFSILPEPDEFLPDATWSVDVIKDGQISKFYYKVTYKHVS